MVKTSTVLAATGITLATSFVCYAAYFDYQRRNNAAFRKKLCRSLSLSPSQILALCSSANIFLILFYLFEFSMA
jgi:hypothetical protein